MRQLRFILWLATILPFSWWAWAWWKIYFEKRVHYVGSFHNPQAPARPEAHAGELVRDLH